MHEPGAVSDEANRPRLSLGLRAIPFAPLLIVAVLFVVSAAVHRHPWLNHDVAVYLHTARGMLRGTTHLYVDWFETNPPTIHVLCTGLVAVSQAIGVSSIAAYHLAVVALGALGLLVLRRAHPEDRGGGARIAVELAYALVVVAASPVALDFGQREHLFTLAFLPYIALRTVDRDMGKAGIVWALVTGALAGMKPHFVVLVALLETALFLRRFDRGRQLRYVGLLALGGALPIGVFAAVWPDSFAGLFETIVPFHLSGAYGAMDRPLGEFLGSSAQVPVVVLAVMCAVIAKIAVTKSSMPRGEALTALVLVIASYLLILQQHKFFSYHLAPTFGLLVYFLATFTVRWPDRLRTTLHTLIALTVALFFLLAFFRRYVYARNDHETMATDVERLIEPGARVHVISVGLDYIHAPFYLDFTTTNRWPHDVLLPSLIGDAGAITAHAAGIRERIVERAPEWVLVEPYPRLYLGDSDPYTLLVKGRDTVPAADYEPVPAEDLPPNDGWLDGWHVYRRR
jgi:hypothetical protein